MNENKKIEINLFVWIHITIFGGDPSKNSVSTVGDDLSTDHWHKRVKSDPGEEDNDALQVFQITDMSHKSVGLPGFLCIKRRVLKSFRVWLIQVMTNLEFDITFQYRFHEHVSKVQC